MDFEGLKLLFCVAAFGWIVYMAFKQKMHKMDPESVSYTHLDVYKRQTERSTDLILTKFIVLQRKKD